MSRAVGAAANELDVTEMIGCRTRSLETLLLCLSKRDASRGEHQTEKHSWARTRWVADDPCQLTPNLVCGELL